MEIYDTTAAERLALVDRLEGLSEAEWSTPSLCDGWTVRDVTAHLITGFEVSVPKLLVYAAKGRGISGAMKLAVRDIGAKYEPAQMLEVLRDNAASRFKPPGMPHEAPLSEVVCHSADIRWPLGDPLDDWSADPQRLRPILDFMVTKTATVAFVAKGRVDGLRFEATDQDWSYGAGPSLRGPSLALVMGMIGRAPAMAALTGDGVEVLAARS